MGLFRRDLDRGAAIHLHREELAYTVPKTVKCQFPAVEGECRRERGRVAAGELLDLATAVEPSDRSAELRPDWSRTPASALSGEGSNALDLLAAGRHRLGPAQAHGTGARNRERPHVRGSEKVA